LGIGDWGLEIGDCWGLRISVWGLIFGIGDVWGLGFGD